MSSMPTRSILGFSQGAMMANAATLTTPERFAGAVLLSGFQPAVSSLTVDPAAVQGKPFFVAHGTQDPMLGIEMGRAVRDSLTELGVDLTYREYEMSHQVIAPELNDFKTWLTERLDGRASPES
jgi:phospholipase/carboxylesterase